MKEAIVLKVTPTGEDCVVEEEDQEDVEEEERYFFKLRLR